MTIITQPKEVIAEFVSRIQRQPEPWGNYTALGCVKEGALVGAVIYNNFGAANVCAHIAAIEGAHWLTREFLFAMFDYPFNQLQKRRITALVAKRNHRARKFVRHLGFQQEGCMKHFFAHDDMICFGMLREHCRFIPQKQLQEAA